MRTVSAVLCALALLLIPTAAHANGKHKGHQIHPSLTCNGTTCTYTVTGVAPGEYGTFFSFVSTSGTGRNTGESARPVDQSGTYTLTDSQQALTDGGTGTLTAELFTDPTNISGTVVPGSQVSTTV